MSILSQYTILKTAVFGTEVPPTAQIPTLTFKTEQNYALIRKIQRDKIKVELTNFTLCISGVA